MEVIEIPFRVSPKSKRIALRLADLLYDSSEFVCRLFSKLLADINEGVHVICNQSE